MDRYGNLPRLCFVWMVLFFSFTTAAQQDVPGVQNPYPRGRQFPLGLYSIHTVEEMKDATKSGWNIAHSYGFKFDFLNVASQGGMFALAHLSDDGEQQDRGTIEQLAISDSVAWWDFPEEQRYWRENEFSLVKNLSQWTRKYDPKQRPNFMYIPSHYDSEAIAKYIPYLDIIGAGCYPEYAHQPRAWVRWRVESEIEAIHKAGFKVGQDYLHGEKTPIGIPMLFADVNKMDIISPVEAYHDFYSCIVSGARGILVFSYWHQRDEEVLRKTYQAYAKAASEIAGVENLGQVILFGEENKNISLEIVSGPLYTYNFRPHGMKEDIRYSSLNVLAKEWNGNLYIFAVNSAEKELKVTLKGLPAEKEATVLFEDRTVPVNDGQFEDNFGWLGVHIYKVAKQKNGE